MPDEVKTPAETKTPEPVLPVAVIGTEDVNLSRRQETVAVTPDSFQNVVVRVITPAFAIFIRFANLFLTTLLGLVAAAMTPTGGKLLYASDFAHTIVVCASLALPGAGIGLIKDLITVFGRLEGKYPLATGSI
jgi:hypothetical protein